LSERVIKADHITWVAPPKHRSVGFSRLMLGNEEKGRTIEINNSIAKHTPSDDQEKKMKAAVMEAYAKGFSEGMEKGKTLERINLHSTIETMTSSFKEISRLKAVIIENSEDEIVKLAFSIAEKILHREISTNADVGLHILKNTIKEITDRERLKILMNPADYRHLTEVNPEAMSSIEGLRNAEIEADDAIGPGGIVIETLFGEVDARIESQLDEVREALTKVNDNDAC